MSIPPPSVRAWAQCLLAVEEANLPASESHLSVALRVSEKLRSSLTRFVGADGFTSLLRRALALARADDPSLHTMNITADGRLEGMEESAADAGLNNDASAITEHLLGLLVTFIGEPLTLRLLRETFREASGSMIVQPEDF